MVDFDKTIRSIIEAEEKSRTLPPLILPDTDDGKLAEYSDDQPRDDSGKFTSGGSGDSGGASDGGGNEKIVYSWSNNKSENIAIAKNIASGEGYKVTTESVIRQPGHDAAVYNNSTGEIYINSKSDYWKDPEGNAKFEYESGNWSSDDPAHPIYHEIGHANNTGTSINWNGGENAAKEVSLYASVNPREFVAEVYAGMRAGKNYSGNVMNIYKQYSRGSKK